MAKRGFPVGHVPGQSRRGDDGGLAQGNDANMLAQHKGDAGRQREREGLVARADAMSALAQHKRDGFARHEMELGAVLARALERVQLVQDRHGLVDSTAQPAEADDVARAVSIGQLANILHGFVHVRLVDAGVLDEARAASFKVRPARRVQGVEVADNGIGNQWVRVVCACACAGVELVRAAVGSYVTVGRCLRPDVSQDGSGKLDGLVEYDEPVAGVLRLGKEVSWLPFRRGHCL